MRRHAIPFAALLAAAAPPAHAAGSTDTCRGFVASLPAVISQQGTWCLDRDLSTASVSGAAITLAANNVTLDCNGYKLGGLGGGSATYAVGVRSDNRMNATVRGCTIRGFYTAVHIGGGAGHLVEDNRLDGNTAVAVTLAGEQSTVRRNLVYDTGGTTQTPDHALGLWAIGHVDVLDNTIAGVSTEAAAAEVVGLRIDEPGFATVAGNRITGLVGGEGSLVHGIQLRYGGRPVARDNTVNTAPVNDSEGISCTGTQGTSTGNVVSGFATPVLGCLSTGDVANET